MGGKRGLQLWKYPVDQSVIESERYTNNLHNLCYQLYGCSVNSQHLHQGTLPHIMTSILSYIWVGSGRPGVSVGR